MAEYIERNAALTLIALTYSMSTLDTDRMLCDALFKMVEAEPSADVAPVKHGKWSDGALIDPRGTWRINGFYCSVCGGLCVGESRYCPNCGAKMDG